MDNNPFDDRAAMYDDSEVTTRTNLDLFSLPKTDISCAYSTQLIPIAPILSIQDDNNPLEFVLNTESSYIDLSETYLKVGFRIMKADGGPCAAATDIVAPANLMFGLMFKNMEVYLNNKLIADTSNNYPYVHYIQRLLTMPDSVKNAKLKGEFYYPNTTPNDYDMSGSLKPKGFKDRFEASKGVNKSFCLDNLSMGYFNNNSGSGLAMS